MTRKLEPVGPRAILRRVDQKKVDRVVIGDLGREEKVQECVVVVPPIATNEIALNAGDTVYIAKSGGWEIEVDGRTFVVIDAEDILVTVREEKEQEN